MIIIHHSSGVSPEHGQVRPLKKQTNQRQLILLHPGAHLALEELNKAAEIGTEHVGLDQGSVGCGNLGRTSAVVGAGNTDFSVNVVQSC